MTSYLIYLITTVFQYYYIFTMKISANILQDLKNDVIPSKYSTYSKSWHKLCLGKDLEESERKWKQKLQEIMRADEFDTSDE